MTEWKRFKEDLYEVPHREGVYLLAISPSDSGIVYIGRADDLNQRLSEHPDPNNPCLQRKSISHFAYEMSSNSDDRERELIDYYNPECNRT